jgi:hypothetical protein
VCCAVVWCAVVWCAVVWCGVVWCGVVWCGVVWCGVVCMESTCCMYIQNPKSKIKINWTAKLMENCQNTVSPAEGEL